MNRALAAPIVCRAARRLDVARPLTILTVCLLVGCLAPSRPGSVSFLGIPESESSDTGPVGLIGGQPYQVKTITAVWATRSRTVGSGLTHPPSCAPLLHGLYPASQLVWTL